MYYVVIFRLWGDTFIFRLLGNTFIFKFNPALHGGAVAVNGTENLKKALAFPQNGNDYYEHKSVPTIRLKQKSQTLTN